MEWLRRIGDFLSPSGGSTDASDTADRTDERSAPGVAAMFRGCRRDGGHAVLDLGPAAGSSLQVYQRYARSVRFADLLTERSEHGLAEALDTVPIQPDRPYDMVFAWNTLDRLLPRERTRLVQRLVEICASDARLHLVTDAHEGASRSPPLRFALLDVDRVRFEPAGPTQPNRNRLLPADVEELLGPFHVARGYTVKGGLREYVAVRGTASRDR